MLSALLMIAPPPDGGLRWDAPAGCATAQEVEAGIERLLAADPSPRMPAEGRIAEREAAWELTVTVAGETRVITTTTCEPLGAVAALVIAVAHDPVAVAAAIPDRQDTAVPEAPTSAEQGSAVQGRGRPPGAETKTVRASSRPRDEPTRGGPRIAGGRSRRHPGRASVRAGVSPWLAVGGGVLPGAGVGFGLGLATFGRRWWRAELTGAGWLPRRAIAPEHPQFGADLWLAGGSLRACGVPRASSVEFPICGGAELDAWAGRGRGPSLARTRQTQLYVAAVASAGAIVQLRPWLALAARAELLVSLQRPAVHIDGVGFVFRARPAAGRLVLGPELRFP